MIKHNLNRPAGAACIVLVLIALVFSLTIATGSWAAPARVTVDSTSPEKINLSVGKSVIIEVKERVKRVSMDSKNVADYHMINPQKFIVTGKSLGITRITLWKDDQAVSRVIDIEVAPNVNELKMKIHELFPEEKNVKVTGAHDALTLSGTVSSSANAAQILTLAQAYASKGQAGKQGAQVINLLEVGGVHQVMLEVRVAEMQRSLLRKLGVNFAYLSDGGNTFGISRLDALTSAAVPGGGLPGVTSSINAIFRFLGGNASWTVFIDALKDEGLTKILAEPTLITLSGKKANFLAGGEFPVPVPQTGGVGTTITIEYKTFGVGLNFTPTVLSDRKISMEVAPEVSQLDFTNAVAFQGFVVPGVTTRRVATVIQEQLRQVGIQVEIQSLEWGTFFSDIKKGNFQLYGLTWVGISDPDIYYLAFHTKSVPPDGANRGGYANLQVNILTDAARREPSRELRREMYLEVQRILARDLPVFPLWAGRNLLVRDRRLQGFALTPDES